MSIAANVTWFIETPDALLLWRKERNDEKRRKVMVRITLVDMLVDAGHSQSEAEKIVGSLRDRMIP